MTQLYRQRVAGEPDDMGGNVATLHYEYELTDATLEDAVLGAAVREAAGTLGAPTLAAAEIVLHHAKHMTEPWLIQEGAVAVFRAIVSTLKAEAANG
jgi:hypothetical protein